MPTLCAWCGREFFQKFTITFVLTGKGLKTRFFFCKDDPVLMCSSACCREALGGIKNSL
jgi:hypothetical protein